ASEESKRAAKLTHDRIAARTTDKDIDVTPDKFEKYFNSIAKFNADEKAKEQLANAPFPILVISGDHDVVLPVENWYALNRTYKNMFIVTFPSSGHGPQHQHPVLAVDNIVSFVSHVEGQM
ncbi:MAG TPA: alpha/beta hydrolase, partial [Cyclobacteriaceae bacterium]